MKTLVVTNRKGGVGKSAVVSQLGYHLHLQRGLRVLVLDFDHQANLSKAYKTGGIAKLANFGAGDLIANGANGKSLPDNTGFVIVTADNDKLLCLESQAEKHAQFIVNVRAFLNAVSNEFDICIIDTNPNPDVRVQIGLNVCSHVVSPIDLNQESIDGIGGHLQDVTLALKTNKAMQHLGLLPTKVEPTPFQKKNLASIIAQRGKMLMKRNETAFCFIPLRSSIARAQAEGKPVWKLDLTSAKDTYKEIAPVFEHIAKEMGV